MAEQKDLKFGGGGKTMDADDGGGDRWDGLFSVDYFKTLHSAAGRGTNRPGVGACDVMAEQRVGVGVGEVRDGKDLKFGSSGETIAGEEVDSSGGDERSGEARDWKDLKFGSSGDKRSGEARDEKDLKFGDGVETADADEDVQKLDSIEFDDFLKSFLGGDYDVSPNDGGDYVPDIWYDSSSNVNLENLDFGSGGGSLGLEGQIKIRPYVGDANGDVNPHRIDGTCPRRIRLQRKIPSGWDGLGRNDDDFEPDTNRLDYFVVAPFDVAYGDDDLGEIGNYGGGGGGGGDTARILISSNNDSGDGDRNDRDMVVRPTLDQERASTGAGGQRLAVGISSNNGGGDDGRRNREILLGQERGSSGGAGYMTQQEPIGISSNNGSGEMVIQNFEQERGGGFEWWIGGGGLWEKLWLLLFLWKIV